jgi:hypothetical protein
MGCFSLTAFLIFLEGCTFVGLWYSSKETREESDFDICRSQSVQIMGLWDALFSFTLWFVHCLFLHFFSVYVSAQQG